jgi:hypothetical protein
VISGHTSSPSDAAPAAGVEAVAGCVPAADPPASTGAAGGAGAPSCRLACAARRHSAQPLSSWCALQWSPQSSHGAGTSHT